MEHDLVWYVLDCNCREVLAEGLRDGGESVPTFLALDIDGRAVVMHWKDFWNCNTCHDLAYHSNAEA